MHSSRRAQEGSGGLRGAQEATHIASPVREFRLNE